MIVIRNDIILICILGVGHLLPTPMHKRFSIEDGILHYDAQGEEEEEEEDPNVAMPEEWDEEKLAHE